MRAQEVVQSLPPEGTQELNTALQRLARNANDVTALIDAGDAALRLGDVAAAIGFFGRAQAIAPSNPRISLGLARAYTLSRRPVEALRLFAEAERGGIAAAEMAEHRALAFDLVGDAQSAQELYLMAIANGADDGARRNLALSQAISGDRAGFEATLLPMLEAGDFAAFRTRAFGLAILGETDAAIKIARDMMPAQAASQIEPYLRYMSELTPAQQAAAGALGVFPRAAAIGRDDVEIATYSPSQAGSVGRADRALEPSGAPLGSPAPARREAELPPVAQSSPPTDPVVAAQDTPAKTVAQPEPDRREQQSMEYAFASFDLPPSASTAPRAGAVDITAIEAPRETNEPPPPVIPARHWVQVATGRDISALGFDWRRISRNSGGELAGKNAFTAPWGEANRLLAGPYDSAGEAREVVGRLKAIGVDSFAFSSARGEEVFPLEGARAAPAQPAPPAHPARHWVQVATGRDRQALGFDWRRIARGAEGELDGKGPFVVEWGVANRLLAGPYDSPAEARDAVNRLKALGIDSFTFTSEDGQAIETLD